MVPEVVFWAWEKNTSRAVIHVVVKNGRPHLREKVRKRNKQKEVNVVSKNDDKICQLTKTIMPEMSSVQCLIMRFHKNTNYITLCTILYYLVREGVV